ncbi:MAG: hypothetical protein ACI8P3_002096 [Saprospiraceae bacterium]|jgi:hypothetical protein
MTHMSSTRSATVAYRTVICTVGSILRNEGGRYSGICIFKKRQEIFQFIKDNVNEFPVKKISEVFKVSRSGYYKWLKNKGCYVEKEEVLNNQIKTVFEESRATYGSPRVHQALQKKEVDISESTEARRMKSLKIRPKIKKRFKNTTDSKHDLKISPNLLNRDSPLPTRLF